MTLEQLLNELIKKGWQPFGWPYYDKFIIESNWDMCFRWQYPWTDWTHSYDYNFDYFKIRELVSKESLLWQFCVENNLLSREDDSIYNLWIIQYVKDNHQTPLTYATVIWWLIESALCDEDKLEQFLLENIKV